MTCGICGSQETISESDGVYCKSCGSPIEKEKVDTTGNYRAYTQEEAEEKERHGSSIDYSKRRNGMKTKIGGRGRMNRVNNSKIGQFRRMKRWNKQNQDAEERMMGRIISSVNRQCSYLNLPDNVKSESCRVLRKIRNEGILKGRETEVVVSTVIYITAKNFGCPRSLDEFQEILDCERRKISGTYRYIAREIEADMKPIQPIELLPRYSQKLGLSDREQAEVRQLIKKSRDGKKFAGKSPTSIIAGYLCYYIKDDPYTSYADVADACNVAKATARKTRQKIENLVEEKEIKN